MKKILWVIILTLLHSNNVFAGVYSRCFIERISHPALKNFERKSFSQMMNMPKMGYSGLFSTGGKYFLSGTNNLINEVEIKIFKEIKFVSTEDASLSSLFHVDAVQYLTPKITKTNIFEEKYKLSAISDEYIEYESEYSKWGNKLILDKKNNIIEIRSRILFFDDPSINESERRVKSWNKDDKKYLLSDELLKFLKNDGSLKYYRPLEEKIEYEAEYPSQFSIFLKCKFKPF
jgi:hypothetical protein